MTLQNWTSQSSHRRNISISQSDCRIKNWLTIEIAEWRTKQASHLYIVRPSQVIEKINWAVRLWDLKFNLPYRLQENIFQQANQITCLQTELANQIKALIICIWPIRMQKENLTSQLDHRTKKSTGQSYHEISQHWSITLVKIMWPIFMDLL